MPQDDYVGLAETIAMLRSELAEARSAGEEHDVRFDVASVVVELGGEVRREGPTGDGLRFYVRTADGAMTTGTSTHRISLTLEAVDETSDRPLRIGDRSRGASLRPPAGR